VRSQFEDQVRRTLGGRRPDKGDVWDIATTEIPPEVGEAPECQWCPVCRAARRMRDAGPGLTGQLSGAGDVVASAVQDAIRGLDALLAKATRGGEPDSSADEAPGPADDAASGSAATESDGPNRRGHGPSDRS
jgi:hypothetical protein